MPSLIARHTVIYMNSVRLRKDIKRALAVTLVLSMLVCPIQVFGQTKQKNSSHKGQEKNLWYFDYLDVPETWDYIDAYKKAHPEKTFKKIKVAVIDTGADVNHEDLQANLDKKHCVDVTAKKSKYPKYTKPVANHGTCVSGIIAATSNNKYGRAGVAAGNHNNLVQVMAIKVFRDTKSGKKQGSARTEDVIRGLDYAYKNGARVINLCYGHDENSTDAQGKPHDDVALEEKINELVANGVVVVCSAGNKHSERVWMPSDYDACISVIASDKYTDIDANCKLPKSSYGPKKDISAPGRNVYATVPNNQYKTWTATSPSAALVSGIVAMMLYVNPDLTVDEVKSLLYSTATDLYTEGYDIYSGHGNVNAYAAVTAASGNEMHISPAILATPQPAAVSMGSDTIKLNWSKASGISTYVVYQSMGGNQYEEIARTKSASYTVGGLSLNKEYNFKVVAKGTSKDGKRRDSVMSNAVVAKPTTGSTKIKVTQVKNSNGKPSGKANISWSVANSATGYEISTAATQNGEFRLMMIATTGEAGSCTVKSPNGNKTGYYKVQPYITDDRGNKIYGPESVVAQ